MNREETLMKDERFFFLIIEIERIGFNEIVNKEL